MPKNAHPDSTFSSFLHNDWTQVQTDADVKEYPQPDIRGPMPKNAHPDSTFNSFLHNDWTQVQTDADVKAEELPMSAAPLDAEVTELLTLPPKQTNSSTSENLDTRYARKQTWSQLICILKSTSQMFVISE